MKRPVGSLTAADFAQSPVWRFIGSDMPDETCVTPVRRLPVKRLDGCVVGCRVRLANGALLAATLCNLDTTNSRSTEHFLMVSLFRSDGAVFHLARYHDFDAAKCGPPALAKFLGLPLKEVFPITYDLSGIVTGPPHVIRGTIAAKPRERLTRAQIIALAVPDPNEVN